MPPQELWNESGKWIWSKQTVHEPLIDTGTFEQVQALHRAKGSADERTPRRTPRAYALRGIVRCGICGPQNARQLEQRPAALPLHVPQPVRRDEQDQPSHVGDLREELLSTKLDAWL